MSVPADKEVPVFSRQNIERMSPLAKGVAAWLEREGEIRITDGPATEAVHG